MPHRFEIKLHTPRRDSTGQPARRRPTSRIRLILQTFAAVLVIAAIAAIGIAIGTVVAILIASLVAIAFAILLVRGMLYRLKSPDPN